MMVIEKYPNYETANLAIQGGLCGGVRTDQPFVGLVGEIVTFATPAGACTFTQPTGRVVGQMHFVDVKAQLEAAVANLRVFSIDNKLAFKHKTPGSAVTLAALSEPARRVLGLDDNTAIAGRCLNGPSGAVPKFNSFVTENLFVYVAVEV